MDTLYDLIQAGLVEKVEEWSMRDIEFRGKSIDTDEWFFGTLFIRPAPPVCFGKRKEDKCYIQFPDPRYTPDWNMPYAMVQGEVKPETVGQYTGLKDKNGKKIYEGDIVKVFTSGKWRIGTVIYEHSGFTIDVTINKDLEYGRTSIIENFTETIRNIYENKELLDKIKNTSKEDLNKVIEETAKKLERSENSK